MSFTTDLRNELVQKIPQARHCRLAELAGMLLYGGSVRTAPDGGIVLHFSTEKDFLAKKYFTLFQKSFNIEIVAEKVSAGNRASWEYSARWTDVAQARQCIEELGFAWPKGRALKAAESLTDWEFRAPERSCCARSLLRAAFLAGGRMNDPDKSYHYEISVPTVSIGELLSELHGRYGCEPKLWERRGSWAVYLKDAEQIGDALTVMEATAARVRFEDIRVVRSKRGEVQRKVNCEISNLAKTTRASSKQIEAIGLIEETMGLRALPEDLEKMARLRIRYPDASLTELGSYTVPPLGRSGVNHRLQKLVSIAEGLRLKEGG